MGSGGTMAMARQVVASGQAAGVPAAGVDPTRKKKRRGLLAGAAGGLVGATGSMAGGLARASGGAPTSVAPTAQTKAY